MYLYKYIYVYNIYTYIYIYICIYIAYRCICFYIYLSMIYIYKAIFSTILSQLSPRFVLENHFSDHLSQSPKLIGQKSCHMGTF